MPPLLLLSLILLPSSAPALTGLLLSVSSLLLVRPAAFPLLPQVHRPADLEKLVKEIMRKNVIIAFPLRAPVWDVSLFAVCWQHRLYKKSDVAVSDFHLSCLCSHLGLRFLFRCLPHNKKGIKLNCAEEHLHLLEENTFKVPQLVHGTHCYKTLQTKTGF